MKTLLSIQPERFEFESASQPMFEEAAWGEETEFSLSQFPKTVVRMLGRGLESVALRLAIGFGYRDENQLTDLVFFARHPERFGRSIRRDEPDYATLSREWLDVRDRLVRPALARPTTRPPTTGPKPTPPAAPTDTTLLPVTGLEKTSQAFREKVIRIAADLQVDPNYLLAVMSFESGFDPAIRNPYSGATGLIQFMPSTASKLGTTTDALARMSAEEQLDYVAAYFAPYKGRMRTLEDTYMVVLWPKAVGQGPGYVLFSSPSTAYTQNSALDTNKDGHITVAEATSFVRKRLPASARELEALSFEDPAHELAASGDFEGEYGAGLAQFPQAVLSTLRSGLETAAVKLAVTFGYRDENQLANLVFFARHPARGGRALTKGEPDFAALSREWLAIRDQLVRPALRGSTPTAPPASGIPATGGTPATGTPDIVNVRGIRVARQIAPQIEALLAAAEADGINLSGGGYRSTASQIELRRKHCGPTDYDIYRKPSSQCTPPTARPGGSQHERGLAIDFRYNGQGIKSHDNPGYQWLAGNAARFGLKNLPSEPWHWSTTGT